MTSNYKNSIQRADQLIDEHNFLFVRLFVADLNDHQPKFNESKYAFYINETTEYKSHYSMSTSFGNDQQQTRDQQDDESAYYFAMLNETCSRLSSRIRVRAYDLDEGVNSIVKYKISHQKHLRNPNGKLAASSAVGGKNFQMLNENRYQMSESENGGGLEASAFYIDEQTGAVYLHVCKQIDDGDFNMVNSLYTHS